MKLLLVTLSLLLCVVVTGVTGAESEQVGRWQEDQQGKEHGSSEARFYGVGQPGSGSGGAATERENERSEGEPTPGAGGNPNGGSWGREVSGSSLTPLLGASTGSKGIEERAGSDLQTYGLSGAANGEEGITPDTEATSGTGRKETGGQHSPVGAGGNTGA